MGDTNRTLYLHCGYHKTGSSFLQMMFAKNRQKLIKEGIYYPLSESELEMQKGEISPGNGSKIAEYLHSGAYDSIIQIFEEGIKKQPNCNSLLYSSELLFHSFGKREALRQLCQIADSVGFKKIDALIYLRDPIQHAISLYKHRAKNGNSKNFKTWIETDYETMDLLNQFCSYYNDFPVRWTFRKYKRDSMFMVGSSFVEWLGITNPITPKYDEVNSSLTLSEIKIIEILESHFHNIGSFLHNELKKIPVKKKNKDSVLSNVYEKTAADYLLKYSILLDQINSKMHENEKLEFKYSNKELGDKSKHKDLNLNEIQIESLAKAFKKYERSKKLLGKVSLYKNKVTSKIQRRLKYYGY